MANKFAISPGNWSSGGTWNDGVVPVSGDDVYANGFTITLDQDINVGSLRNTTPPVYLPNMAIPLMTSNTLPSGTGTVFAGQNPTTAFQAFDQNSTTSWTSTDFSNCTVGYQFTSGKIIKIYYLDRINENGRPNTWTFQGSMDGTTYINLDIVSANAGTTGYLSGVLSNTTGFTYYRINISAAVNTGYAVVRGLEMTEFTGATYGSAAGGTFAITTGRTVTLTADGGLYGSSNSTGVISVNANSPSIVNITSTTNKLTNNTWASANGIRAIQTNGTGTVNVVGDLFQPTSVSYALGNLYINGNGTVNYSGNSYSPPVGSAAGGGIYVNVNNVTLNITGNLYGSDYATVNAYGLYNIGTGNIINISGSTIGRLSPAIGNTSTSSLFINGPISASTNSNAILNSSTGLLSITGPVINTSTVMAIITNKIRFYSGVTAQWTVQDTTNSNITLSSISSSGVTIGLPLSGDVRYLTTYGQNNEYVGSLRVPSVDNVRKGVQTDFTVGTADLTANDIFSAITTSSNSVAVRLRNVSTVQSAGDQIASLS